MGGRGRSSSGAARAPNGYRTVGKIGNDLVIKSNGEHSRGLPFNGKPNVRYYRPSNDGKIYQIREYNKRGTPKRDYDWNHRFRENGKSYPKGTPHYHKWDIKGNRIERHYIITQEKFDKMFPNIKDKEF